MRYKFVNDREALIADFKGAILQPNQIFDPADFGLPEWTPEPNPHPLFELIGEIKVIPVVSEVPRE